MIDLENLTYQQDGLFTRHNCDFMQLPDFKAAYDRGVKAAGADYLWHWRVHIGLWGARTAFRVAGDFVECGVNAGFLSSAIMQDLNWNEHDRSFFLLDTFSGIDTSQLTADEINAGAIDKNQELITNGFYVKSVELVKQNFSEWKNAVVIEGRIPETLSQITSDQIAFVHIDLNNATPEVAALEFLWDKITPGGVVLLDDYAYDGYHFQKHAIDEFAQERNINIASLPTGQGLIFKN